MSPCSIPRQAGFSVLEILISIGIGLMLIGIGYKYLGRSISEGEKQVRRVYAKQLADATVRAMSRNYARAFEVNRTSSRRLVLKVSEGTYVYETRCRPVSNGQYKAPVALNRCHRCPNGTSPQATLQSVVNGKARIRNIADLYGMNRSDDRGSSVCFKKVSEDEHRVHLDVLDSRSGKVTSEKVSLIRGINTSVRLR